MKTFIVIMGWLGLFVALMEWLREYADKKRNPEKYIKCDRGHISE